MKNEKYMSYLGVSVVLLFVFGGAFLYSDLLAQVNTSNEVLTDKIEEGDKKPLVKKSPKTELIEKKDNVAVSKVHIGGVKTGDAYTYLVIEE